MITWYFEGKRLEKEAVEKNIRNKDLILFGADINRNKQLFEEIDKKNIKYIFDNDEKKWGMDQDGIPIIKPFAVKEDIVLISGIHDWKTISKQVEKMGYQNIYFFLTKEAEMAVGKYISEFSPNVYKNSILQDLTFKYIHFISDEKFFASVIEYIEYGLNINDHFFVIYNMNGANRNDIYGLWDKYKELSKKYHNIYLCYHDCWQLNLIDWDENRNKLNRLLEKAKKIIFHGEAITPEMYEYFLDKVNLVREKGVLIPWSGNLGRDEYTKPIIENVLQHVKMIPYAYAIDKEAILHYFPRMSKAIWLKSGVSYARLTEYIPRKEETSKNILIAHSSHDYTKAKETLKYLAGIKQNVCIYCITSYGEQEIIEEIKCFGERLFGDCFIAMDKYMNYAEYVRFLSQMDLAVFGMDFLSGRDTLELLFWLGKKVYLKCGSEAFRRMEVVGYRINDYYNAKKDIEKELFDNEDREWNHSVASNEFCSKKKLEQWRELYEYPFDAG